MVVQRNQREVSIAGHRPSSTKDMDRPKACARGSPPPRTQTPYSGTENVILPTTCVPVNRPVPSGDGASGAYRGSPCREDIKHSRARLPSRCFVVSFQRDQRGHPDVARVA